MAKAYEDRREEESRNRESLYAELQLYRGLVEKALLGVYITSLEGDILYANEAAWRMFGFDTREEITSAGADALYRNPQHRERFLGQLSRDGHVTSYELDVLTKQGEPRRVSVSATLSEDRIVGMLVDVTEQDRAEQEMETIKAQLEYVLGATQTGFDIIDEDFNLVYVNPQWAAVLGDHSGRRCHEYFMGRSMPCEECAIPWALKSGRPAVREQFLVKEGKVVRVHTIPLKETAQGKRLVAEFNIDITESKRAEEKLKESYTRMRRMFDDVVHAMASTIELRDPYTAGHQRRVAELAIAIAQEMGIPEEEQAGLRVASLVHDVGKSVVPAEILTKPTSLNPLEMGMVKVHPEEGRNVLRSIEFPWPVAEIVHQHHERMNGSGYPRGLKGDEILREARVLAVADVVEALVSHRPYRPALELAQAMEKIRADRGVLYDPEVVDACNKLFTDGFRFSEHM